MTEAPAYFFLSPDQFESGSNASKWLGRIVKEYSSPNAEFAPEDPSRYLAGTSEMDLFDLTRDQATKSATELYARIGNLVSLGHSGEKNAALAFETPCIRCVKLQHHAKVFERLQNDPETKAWLLQHLTTFGKPAFLIVSLLIYTDASITTVRNEGGNKNANLRLPLSAAVGTTAGIPLPAIDPEGGARKSDLQESHAHAKTKGSKIFAFQYRILRRQPFTVKLGHFGPKSESSKLFGGEEHVREGNLEKDQLALRIDEEDVPWEEEFEEDGNLKVESLGGCNFALKI
ncbi:hypothetical protein B0J14DRAFT_605159 [Halenospora varia]|nr:hypothetical protein B0J14DRAFT_605159 [Halenospora varia]